MDGDRRYDSRRSPKLADAVLALVSDSCALSRLSQIDGDWRYDSRRSTMLWTIDLVDDQNRTGSMEFIVRLEP